MKKIKINNLLIIGVSFLVLSCSTDEKQKVITKKTLVMSEEFNVDGAPDSNLWSYNIGTGANGWGNNELQYNQLLDSQKTDLIHYHKSSRQED